MRWGWIACLPLCLLLAPGKHVLPDDAPMPRPSLMSDDGQPLPTAMPMEELARTDPVAFLETCWKRSNREYHGFRCRMYKQETIGKTTHPPEDIEVAFRDTPHAAYLRWHAGARQPFPFVTVQRALYVVGENNGQIVAAVTGPLGAKTFRDIDPNSSQARDSGRYPLPEFGLKKAIERTHTAWNAAKVAGRLRVEYQGVRPVAEVNGRPCHVLVRTCDPPEEEGLTRVEIAIDAENWLQVSSKLTGANGKHIATYHFRDVEVNPTFDADQFTKAALSR